MKEAILEMTNRTDIFVHLTPDFPLGIDEYVRRNPDGYDIYISEKLCDYQRREAYMHALMHILNGDLDNEQCVSDAEWRCVKR